MPLEMGSLQAWAQLDIYKVFCKYNHIQNTQEHQKNHLGSTGCLTVDCISFLLLISDFVNSYPIRKSLVVFAMCYF